MSRLLERRRDPLLDAGRERLDVVMDAFTTVRHGH